MVQHPDQDGQPEQAQLNEVWKDKALGENPDCPDPVPPDPPVRPEKDDKQKS